MGIYEVKRTKTECQYNINAQEKVAHDKVEGHKCSQFSNYM